MLVMRPTCAVNELLAGLSCVSSKLHKRLSCNHGFRSLALTNNPVGACLASVWSAARSGTQRMI